MALILKEDIFMQYYRVFFKGENKEGKGVYRCVWVYADDKEDAKEKALIEEEIVDRTESSGIRENEEIDWVLDYVVNAPCME